jgi:site-specific DNA-methyltransferase (adenine-specific)
MQKSLFEQEENNNLNVPAITMPNSNIELYHGDCLELMKDILDGSIDAIICDLPYGTTNCSWDSPIDLIKLWEQYERIIKPNGAIVLTAQTPFDKVLGVSNLKLLRYEWIWEKTHATGHLNAKKMPMKSHENILVFYKSAPTYNPIMTYGHTRKVASAKNRAACIARRNDTDDIYNNEDASKVNSYDSTTRYPRSVVKFKTDKQTSSLHKTQKPTALMEYLINTYTNEGETVLDNCMGSGTTGVACKSTGRNFIGMEKDEKYFEIAKKRIEDF